MRNIAKIFFCLVIIIAVVFCHLPSKKPTNEQAKEAICNFFAQNGIPIRLGQKMMADEIKSVNARVFTIGESLKGRDGETFFYKHYENCWPITTDIEIKGVNNGTPIELKFQFKKEDASVLLCKALSGKSVWITVLKIDEYPPYYYEQQ
jgi:hypothetical protein